MSTIRLAKYVFFLCCQISISCGEIRLKRYTPKEFINNVPVPRIYYTKDSIQILDTLRNYLKGHRYSFYPETYFDSTQVIIDTIIHNDSYNKFIVFVITKNPTYRQLIPDANSNWYYDATSYIGIRNKGDIQLAWIGPSFTNSIDVFELSNIIRESYFTEFSRPDTVGDHMYKYNMNDVRFWQSTIWEKLAKVKNEIH